MKVIALVVMGAMIGLTWINGRAAQAHPKGSHPHTHAVLCTYKSLLGVITTLAVILLIF